jgi:hypothetical protein
MQEKRRGPNELFLEIVKVPNPRVIVHSIFLDLRLAARWLVV